MTPSLSREMAAAKNSDLVRAAEGWRRGRARLRSGASRKRDADGRPSAWLVWAVLWVVYVVWGSTYLAIRVVVETMPPFLSAGVRFLVAGAILAAFLLIRRGISGLRAGPGELVASAVIGTLLLLGGNGLVMVAEQDVPAGLAALLVASVPLWVAVLRWLFEDGVDRGTLFGVILGFLGVALLVVPGRTSTGVALGGMALLVLASLSWASGSFLSRRMRLPKDPFTSTTWQMLLGGVALGAAGLIGGEGSGLDVAAFSAASIGGLAYLVIAGSLVGFTAYTWLLHNAPISKVSTYAYVNPVVAIFLGWLLLSETLTLGILVAAAVILAAVALIVHRESREAVRARNADRPEPPAAEGRATETATGPEPATPSPAAPPFDLEAVPSVRR
ncbi:MAG TPA: EamA family transporter [Actinomycetota bacterium]|nr:EamA family transporter [Actinomycetota bacterium]